MSQSFTFRPGTNDKDIFEAVYTYNEYKLPDVFQSDDIIIDIGAHIGSFCYACLLRGSNHVYGFEAELENYKCAVANLESFGERVHLYHKAIWRSDRKQDKLFHTGYSQIPEQLNTGGGNVMWATQGIEVDVIALDDVIQQVTADGKGRVELIKIDVEGAEFPILMTSKNLHLVNNICGEYHEIMGEYDDNSMPANARIPGYDRFTIVELTKFLERAGFYVESFRHENTHLGEFFASRPGRVRRWIFTIRDWFYSVKNSK